MKKRTARYLAETIIKRYNQVRMDIDNDNPSEKTNGRERAYRLSSDIRNSDKG